MQYRKFGKTGFDASILGVGCMRLPIVGNDSNVIDEPVAIKMIHSAIDSGVNYIDTAYVYHGGKSEGIVAKALAHDGYRSKVKIADKSPVFLMEKPEDFDTLLDEQLKRLNTDHIDFYLLHALSAWSWENKVLKFDVIDRAEKAKKAGKIGHIGFSFHDNKETFYKICDYYDWEFCLLQMNYLNEDYQQGLEGLKHAHSKGMGICIMEPMLGGKLANTNKTIMDVFQSCEPDRTAVEWALGYLWDIPEVSVVLSGMSSIENINDNVTYAARAKAFTDKEKQTVQLVKQKFSEIESIPCTRCAYCMPCPNDVDIPGMFEFYNSLYSCDDKELVKRKYFLLSQLNEPALARNCVQCKVCEDKCPQKIEIAALMPKVEEAMTK